MSCRYCVSPQAMGQLGLVVTRRTASQAFYPSEMKSG